MPPPVPETARWFDEHVLPHEPILRGWLRSKFSTETDIDDVVQDAYIRLFRARERRRGGFAQGLSIRGGA